VRSFVVPPGQDEVGQWHVLKHWPAYGKWFEVSAEQSRGQFSVEDFVEMVASGRGVLWTFWTDDRSECLGAGLVELTSWNAGRMVVAVIRWVAGEDVSQWKHFMPEVEEWAKAAGAQRIIFDGRKGWQRLAPDYEIVNYTYSKELI
jgi:hypothetical protein